MIPHCCHLRCTRVKEAEIVNLDYHMKAGHLGLGKIFPDNVIHEKHLGLGMIYEVVDVLRLEFMENRNRYGAVCQSRKE